MDLSSIFQPVPGLLSPEQQSNANGQAWLGMAAALAKAAAPSPYKFNTVSGIGEGLQGLLGGYNNAQDQALKQQLVRGQINQQQSGQLLQALQLKNTYEGLGMPVPPELANMLAKLGISNFGGLPQPTQGAAPAQATPGIPQPQASAPAAPAAPVPGGAPVGPGAGPAAPSAPVTGGGMGGAAAMGPTGAAAGPMAGPNGIAQIVQSMGLNPKILLGSGPAADIAKGVAIDNLKTTPEQKNVRDPAVQASKRADKQYELDAARYDKLFGGLQAQGNTAAKMLPNIQLAKGLINDPNFVSGIGEPVQGTWNRVKAALGGDPNAALSGEAYKKVLAANVLQQVNDMKAASEEMGSSSSRLFAPEIDLMQKAAGTLDNSPQTLRLLTTMHERLAQRNMQIADMATDYKQQHGALDAGFEKDLRKYMSDHPLFQASEMSDIRKLTAQSGPASVGHPEPASKDTPPMEGARKAPDGNWYVQKDGKTYRVN